MAKKLPNVYVFSIKCAVEVSLANLSAGQMGQTLTRKVMFANMTANIAY